MSAIRALASPSLRSLATQRTGAAMFTTSVRSFDVFKDKERGDESIHFRKEDERLLSQLLHKVKAAAEKVGVLVVLLCSARCCQHQLLSHAQ